ncbi:MAG: Mur ligase family protein [Spirochaetia bacterium]|nr:Mur ligase family protein [Spirochaetia bacterium]
MKKTHIHFSGICGTAMASAAVLLKKAGFKITGSDENFYPPMGDYLKDNNIELFKGYGAQNLNDKPNLIVIGNALSRKNIEVEEILNKRMPFCSLPELIKNYILKDSLPIVISGTHGKSTTTALLAWVLETADKKPGYLFAAKSLNFKDNANMPQKNGFFVIEGDEYDTAFFDKRSKFLHYMPQYLFINNLEFDHGDIFNSLDEILLSFKRLVNIVPQNGKIFVNGDDKNIQKVTQNALCEIVSFGFSKNCGWKLLKIKHAENGIYFNIENNGKIWENIYLPLAGRHNALNALSVFAAAIDMQISAETVIKAFSTFKGLKRRLELFAKKEETYFYDDFAHHPTAIEAVLSSVKERHKKYAIIAVLDLRSNTMVKNIFKKEITSALKKADVVILGKIHRKEKIPVKERLDIKYIIQNLKKENTQAFHIEKTEEIAKKIINFLELNNVKKNKSMLHTSIHPIQKKSNSNKNVVLLMSNGSFDGLKEKICGLI